MCLKYLEELELILKKQGEDRRLWEVKTKTEIHLSEALTELHGVLALALF